MKVVTLHTATNAYTIRPGDGFVFMNFVHTLIAFGGFTDGASLWIPTTAIQALKYEEETTTEGLEIPTTMQ